MFLTLVILVISFRDKKTESEATVAQINYSNSLFLLLLLGALSAVLQPLKHFHFFL